MIHSYRDRDTQSLAQRRRVKKFEAIENAARKKLALLDAASDLDDLASFPGLRLEKLKGDRAGQHSIRVNDQYRLCFRWNDGAHDVELTDYH